MTLVPSFAARPEVTVISSAFDQHFEMLRESRGFTRFCVRPPGAVLSPVKTPQKCRPQVADTVLARRHSLLRPRRVPQAEDELLYLVKRLGRAKRIQRILPDFPGPLIESLLETSRVPPPLDSDS